MWGFLSKPAIEKIPGGGTVLTKKSRSPVTFFWVEVSHARGARD